MDSRVRKDLVTLAFGLLLFVIGRFVFTPLDGGDGPTVVGGVLTGVGALTMLFTLPVLGWHLARPVRD